VVAHCRHKSFWKTALHRTGQRLAATWLATERTLQADRIAVYHPAARSRPPVQLDHSPDFIAMLLDEGRQQGNLFIDRLNKP